MRMVLPSFPEATPPRGRRTWLAAPLRGRAARPTRRRPSWAPTKPRERPEHPSTSKGTRTSSTCLTRACPGECGSSGIGCLVGRKEVRKEARKEGKVREQCQTTSNKQESLMFPPPRAQRKRSVVQRPPPAPKPRPQPQRPQCRALYQYVGQDADEISFNASDVFELVTEGAFV